LHDVIELWSTNSIRQMKKVFRTLKEKQEQFQLAEQQQEQQSLEQQAAIAQATLEQERMLEERKMQNENINKQLDRLSKEKIAIIQALGFGKVEGEDVNSNEVYDVLESGKLDLERERLTSERNLRLIEMQNENRRDEEKMKLEKEKLKVERENMANDERIARIQASAKKKEAKKKPKKK